jgi:hypothetical protein
MKKNFNKIHRLNLIPFSREGHYEQASKLWDVFVDIGNLMVAMETK